MGTNAVERRFQPGNEFRLQERQDQAPMLRGYAAVFNKPTVVGNWYEEVIAPGAFTAVLRGNPDVRALFNHDCNLVLGRTKAGTLRLVEDATGLSYEIEVPETQGGQDLLTSVRRGDVDGASFAFVARKETWEEREGDLDRRTIVEVGELVDVSPVTFPQYLDSTVAVRSRERWLEQRGATAEQRGSTPYADLPAYAENVDRPYEEDAVLPRVRAWASSDGSGDKDTIDWAKYRKAFFWYDPSDGENFRGYKLKSADVIDGKLYAIWRGVSLAMAVLNGARGGVNIPDADRQGVYKHVGKYYGKFDKDQPELKSQGRGAGQLQRMRMRLALTGE